MIKKFNLFGKHNNKPGMILGMVLIVLSLILLSLDNNGEYNAYNIPTLICGLCIFIGNMHINKIIDGILISTTALTLLFAIAIIPIKTAWINYERIYNVYDVVLYYPSKTEAITITNHYDVRSLFYDGGVTIDDIKGKRFVGTFTHEYVCSITNYPHRK